MIPRKITGQEDHMPEQADKLDEAIADFEAAVQEFIAKARAERHRGKLSEQVIRYETQVLRRQIHTLF